jgi:hypothetical protein
MLERLWRGLGPQPDPLHWGALIALVLLVSLWMLRR